MEKLKEPVNMAKLPVLIPKLHQAVLTNFSPDQLLAFAQHMKEFPHDGMQSMTLQSYGNQEKGHRGEIPGVPRGMSVQFIEAADITAAEGFLHNLQPPPPPTPTPTTDADGNPLHGSAAA